MVWKPSWLLFFPRPSEMHYKELFGSRLLTVRLSCGRQDLVVLPLNCASLVHFLSCICCVLFSFFTTPWTAPEPLVSLKICSMLLLSYSWNREQSYTEGTSTAVPQVVGDGDLCPANWFQKSSMFSPPFRWQRNAVKAWGAGPSVAADVIKSLLRWVACTVYLISSS